MPAASISYEQAATAVEMAKLGHTSESIAPILGISGRSIRDILNKHGRWGEIAETPVFARLRHEQSKVLESAFRAGAAKLFERAFDAEKLDKASTYQLVTSAAIAFDKARLAAGESSINIEVHVDAVVTIDDLSSRLSRRLIDPNK
jgi:predicted transcriptional regulator